MDKKIIIAIIVVVVLLILMIGGIYIYESKKSEHAYMSPRNVVKNALRSFHFG